MGQLSISLYHLQFPSSMFCQTIVSCFFIDFLPAGVPSTIVKWNSEVFIIIVLLSTSPFRSIGICFKRLGVLMLDMYI